MSPYVTHDNSLSVRPKPPWGNMKLGNQAHKPAENQSRQMVLELNMNFNRVIFTDSDDRNLTFSLAFSKYLDIEQS